MIGNLRLSGSSGKGVVRVDSILPAGALGRGTAPLFLLMNCRRAKTGAGPRAAKTPAFKWVNTALGNIKAALVGTYRAVRSKHVQRYLAEFEYRFNRRYDLAAMIPRRGVGASEIGDGRETRKTVAQDAANAKCRRLRNC